MDGNHGLEQRRMVSRRDSFRWFGLVGMSALLGTGGSLNADEIKPTATNDLQGAGFYKTTMGEATLFLLSDGGFPMDPTALFGTVPEGEIADARRAAFISTPTVPGHVNALLVKEGSNLILVDTGCGSSFGPTTGRLALSLKRAGFTAEQITHVIITHAHPDHIGGLVGSEGSLAYPKAQVIINRAEHEFWTQSTPSFANSKLPAEMIKGMIEGARLALDVAKPKLELVKPEAKVGSLITIVDAAGHTPGHIALQIGEGDRSVLYVTDAVHVPSLQLAHPYWHVLYDADPEQAVTTRRALLERASKSRQRIAGAHIPFPSFGNVFAESAGYRFVPSVWEW